MLKQTSPEFRALFILQFTKELIRNSKPKEFFIEKSPSKKITPRLIKRNPQKIRLREIRNSQMLKVPGKIVANQKFLPQKNALDIQEPTLPPNLQYLRPTPTNLDIDLKKLNPLLRDSAIKVIECNGANTQLIVKGMMGSKPTNIILTEDEISEVVEKFSSTAKIPINEGVFKVAVGRLILIAIISEVISSKFIIKKMTLPFKGVLNN